jgi:purine nucleoside permease
VGHVTEEENQKEEKEGYGMYGIGVPHNNTIINAKRYDHEHKAYQDPVYLLNIERVTSAPGQVKTGAIEVQQTQAAYRHHNYKEDPVKIKKQSAIDLQSYAPS